MVRSYQINEDVHDSSKVPDDGGGGEEQAVGHDLQVQLDAHEDHKHILSNLKQTWQVRHAHTLPTRTGTYTWADERIQHGP